MLRNALLECRGIHRVFGSWLPVALLLLGLAAWFQEPVVLRLSGVHLFWGAVRAGLILALALVPLAWLLARRPHQQEWLVARARSRWDLVLPPFAGMALYGACLVGGAGLVFITLDRMHALPAPVWDVAKALLRAWVFLLPLAAISPGLASRSWGHATRVLVFSLCAAGSLILAAPPCLSPQPDYGTGRFEVQGIALLPPVLASAAGILLSLRLVLRSTS